jgi:hypothetical protein
MRRTESQGASSANSLRVWLVGYMHTRSEFVAWLDVRRSAGDSLNRDWPRFWRESPSCAAMAERRDATLPHRANAGRAALPRAAVDGPWPPGGRRERPTELVVRDRVTAQALTPLSRIRWAPGNGALLVVVKNKAGITTGLNPHPVRHPLPKVLGHS